jgi:hypothetical protein
MLIHTGADGRRNVVLFLCPQGAMENYVELASIAEFVNQAAYTSSDSYKNLKN